MNFILFLIIIGKYVTKQVKRKIVKYLFTVTPASYEMKTLEAFEREYSFIRYCSVYCPDEPNQKECGQTCNSLYAEPTPLTKLITMFVSKDFVSALMIQYIKK